MYQQHFGLDRQPFKITPDTSLFFEGSQRGAALEALRYAIKSGEGIIKVVGEVGSGKTMLCRMLELRLQNDAVDVVYIANPSLSPDNILHVIADELQLETSNSSGHERNKVAVMQQIQAYLLEKHGKNQQVVLFVEEAQSMPVETLEEIRLLSNLETDQNKLLQMVLFGQPELDEKLSQVHIRQLKERITHSFYLAPFAPEDTLQYLNFRLRAVGYRGPDIFTKKTAASVKKYSGGLTRRINILADKALLAAFSEGGHNVTCAHIKSAAIDSEFVSKGVRKKIFWVLTILLVLLAVLGLGVMIGQLQQRKVINSMPVPAQSIKQAGQGIQHEIPVQKIKAQKIQTQKTSASVNKTVSVNKAGHVLERLQATQVWLSQVNDSDYSIQLFMAPTSDQNAVETFLRKLPVRLDITKIYIYETKVNGRSWYSVVYADFVSKQEAIQALKNMPDTLQASLPYLRRLSAIKNDLYVAADG